MFCCADKVVLKKERGRLVDVKKLVLKERKVKAALVAKLKKTAAESEAASAAAQGVEEGAPLPRETLVSCD